jgi:hypothetical protein
MTADRLVNEDKNSCLEAQLIAAAPPVHPSQHSGEILVAAHSLDGKDKSGCLEDQLVAATTPVSRCGNGDCSVATPPPVHRSGTQMLAIATRNLNLPIIQGRRQWRSTDGAVGSSHSKLRDKRPRRLYAMIALHPAWSSHRVPVLCGYQKFTVILQWAECIMQSMP